MIRRLIIFLSAAPLAFAGPAVADSHSEGGSLPASPVELFACKYAEGKGPKDYDMAVKDFNKWADTHELTEYSAWTLTPYYFSPEQDFDFIWLGGTEKAETLGRYQDTWIRTGAKEAAHFDEVAPCDGHSNFTALRFKSPPERDDRENVVISFTDCNLAEGVTFGDLVPSIMEWAKYREGHGSTAGMWALMPAYGGGGEEFDFKWINSYQNLEEQGMDYDQYNEEGWRKVNELFEGKVSCDSSRVYLATNRRMAESDE